MSDENSEAPDRLDLAQGRLMLSVYNMLVFGDRISAVFRWSKTPALKGRKAGTSRDWAGFVGIASLNSEAVRRACLGPEMTVLVGHLHGADGPARRRGQPGPREGVGVVVESEAGVGVTSELGTVHHAGVRTVPADPGRGAVRRDVRLRRAACVFVCEPTAEPRRGRTWARGCLPSMKLREVFVFCFPTYRADGIRSSNH